MNLVALMWLIPTAALAQGAIGFAADPNLHVNPNLKDCSVQFAPELTQAAFARFTREFGSVSAFKMTSPPATLGKGHVSFGLEEMSFSVEEKSDAWNDTFYHPNDEHPLGATHNFPKLRLRAGVTDHLDIGAFYTANANANYGWFGLEAKYGLLRQGEETPISLALRGAYTKTLYVDDMSMDAVTADVAAGRTFRGWFTPYLGVGADAVLARETSNAVALQDEKHVVPHALGGLEVRLWHVALGAEGYLSELNSVQMQVTALF
jgi:opacity protein-like surface antigen